jgi:hypothetical protein
LATLTGEEDHIAAQDFEHPLVAPAGLTGENSACERDELR